MKLVVNMAKLKQAGFGDIIEKAQKKNFSVWHTKNGDIPMKKVGEKWVPANVGLGNSASDTEIKKRKRIAEIKAMTKRGDMIRFEKEKKLIDGMVVAKGDDGVTAKKVAFAYQVPYENIKQNLTKEGTISPENFNAADYRNKYQDSKIAELEKASKGAGVKYFLDKYLPGAEGKEMSKKADETELRVKN